MRAFFQALFGLVLRIFFRRIEVSGTEHVPTRGPVLFVLNHPNGLLDPAFLLCLAPRRVSFLAKAPLFRMPLIGFFCRAFEAIPVSRRQDAGFDPSQNRETFETARAVLERGGAIAIFPEGASHSEPRLRALKTGAALAQEFELRRRFLEGYDVVRARWPDRFAALATRIDRYEAALTAAGLDPRQLAPRRFTLRGVARYTVKALLFFLLLLPAAAIGVVVHYPVYRAVGFVATGIAKRAEDAQASIKVLAAMLLFPVTWALAAVAAWRWQGVGAALLTVTVLPLTAYAALLFSERLDRLIGAARALALFTFRRWAFLRLLAERKVIRDEILQLARSVFPP